MVPNPIKMDDLGGFPPIFGNTQLESEDNFYCLMPTAMWFTVSLLLWKIGTAKPETPESCNVWVVEDSADWQMISNWIPVALPDI